MRRIDKAVPGGVDHDVGELPLDAEVDARWASAEVLVDDVSPLRARQLVAGGAEQVDLVTLGGEAVPSTPGDVVDDPEHTHDRGRQDRLVAGLVVEADVATGDGQTQLTTAVGQTAGGLRELPHHRRVLG